MGRRPDEPQKDLPAKRVNLPATSPPVAENPEEPLAQLEDPSRKSSVVLDLSPPALGYDERQKKLNKDLKVNKEKLERELTADLQTWFDENQTAPPQEQEEKRQLKQNDEQRKRQSTQEDEARRQKCDHECEQLELDCHQRRAELDRELVELKITTPDDHQRNVQVLERSKKESNLQSRQFFDERQLVYAQQMESLERQFDCDELTALAASKKAVVSAREPRCRGEKGSQNFPYMTSFLENLRKKGVLHDGCLRLPAGVYLGGYVMTQHLGGQLLIRQCYINLCELIFEMARVGEFESKTALKTRNFLVQGSPGIGKTMFSYYLLHRLMQLGKTIVWHPAHGGRRILITPESIQFDNMLDGFAEELSLPTTWFIVDAAAPPEANAFTVLITKPRRDIIKHFEITAIDLYMPVWSLDEIRRAHGLGLGRSWRNGEKAPLEEAEKRFAQFGGIPPYVFECGVVAKDALEQQLLMECVSLRIAVNEANISKFAAVIGHVNNAGGACDTAVQIIVDTETGPSRYRSSKLQFASPSVEDELARQIVYTCKYDLFRFLRVIEDLPLYSIIHRQIFKGFVHCLLAKGGKFKVGKLRKDAVPTDVTTITLGTSTVTPFKELSELTVHDKKLYYKFIDLNFVGIDSLMLPDMLIHVVVADEHPVKMKAIEEAAKTLRDLQKQSRSKSNSPCVIHLYFIVPEAQFDGYREQDLVDDGDRVLCEIDSHDLRVEQYVLGVRLAGP